MAIVNFPQEINGIRVVQSDEEVVKALKNGETVCRYEWGDSMTPVLKNGEYANLTPIKDINEVQRGDAVFCVLHDDMGGSWPMVHQVWEISDASHTGKLWFKIGSTGTSVFGWTNEVYGIAKGTDIFQEFTKKWKDYFKAQEEEKYAET